jgi:hypothetical protein
LPRSNQRGIAGCLGAITEWVCPLPQLFVLRAVTEFAQRRRPKRTDFCGELRDLALGCDLTLAKACGRLKIPNFKSCL